MCQIIFSKSCDNTEAHSFADTYAIRIFDEGNSHYLLALF